MTAEPDALRLVPVEPTKAMLAAGQAAGDYGDALRRAWSAMLSAAPTVPLSTPMGGEVEALREAATNLARVIRAAGVRNLSDGVRLGPVSWAVKCNDALKWVDRALADSSPSPAQGGRPSDEQVRRAIQARLHLHPTDETLGCLDRAVADIQALFAPPSVQPVEGE